MMYNSRKCKYYSEKVIKWLDSRLGHLRFSLALFDIKILVFQIHRVGYHWRLQIIKKLGRQIQMQYINIVISDICLMVNVFIIKTYIRNNNIYILHLNLTAYFLIFWIFDGTQPYEFEKPNLSSGHLCRCINIIFHFYMK